MKQRLPRPPGARPDWVSANPATIAAKAARAATRPTGGWVVAGISPKRGGRPKAVEVDGGTYVLWHDGTQPQVAPDVCPHMGARLSCGWMEGDDLCCPWHDLRLNAEGHAWWKPLPTYDDGVLTWVRLEHDAPTEAPLIPKRPDSALTAAIERSGRCEVRDIVENRLDPWHGRYLHPYAFRDLVVVDEDDSGITCEVDYRILGPITTKVTARFDATEAATVRMVIIDGVGAGSVVETHATMAGPEKCRVIEALFATSEGTDLSTRWFGPGMARFLGRVADRLWRDDVMYAERRYAVRRGEVSGWQGTW